MFEVFADSYLIRIYKDGELIFKKSINHPIDILITKALIVNLIGEIM